MLSRAQRHALPVLLAGLLAAASAPVAAGKTVTVRMKDTLNYVPASVTIHVGDTVVWKNSSILTHTVTDVPDMAAKAGDVALPKRAKSFNSGYLDPNKTFKHTFKVAGTYRYFCIPHEATGMVGTVTVKPASQIDK